MLEVRLKKKQGDFLVDTAFTSNGSGVTALFGRSGAGKTSVINMLSGLNAPDEGRIVVNGTVLFDSEKNIHVPAERRRFGYVFQDGRLFPHLSVRSNLVYGMKRIPPQERYLELEPVVDLLGISHLMDRRPATLSGGEKQRVAIGRSLLTSPVMLLMDEPLASLDENRKKEVMPFISRMSDQLSIPILYVTHSLEEIFTLADTLVFLAEGRTLAAGPVEEVVLMDEFVEFTGSQRTGAVFTACIESHDRSAGFTRLAFPGGLLTLPLTDLPREKEVRIQVLASDVEISLVPLPRTSFSNIFPGKILSLGSSGPDNSGKEQPIRIGLDTGASVWASVPCGMRQALNLTTGMQVYAVINRVSVFQAA